MKRSKGAAAMGMLVSWVSTAQALTNQDFEGAGTPFQLWPAAVGASPGVIQETNDNLTNNFLRLTDAGGQHASITFRLTERLRSRVIVDFDFRITPVAGLADGLGFAFLRASRHAQAEVAPPGIAEGPDFEDSIGVGFDVYQNPGEPEGQHISLHYGSEGEREPIVVSGEAVPDLASGGWFGARIIIEFGADKTWVSVALRRPQTSACAVVKRAQFEGVAAYQGKAWFGARTAGEAASFDLDNVRVEAVEPSETGAWDLAECGPAVLIHSALLPTGKVMTWDRMDFPRENGTLAGPYLVDPTSGAVTPAAQPGYDAFCSGHTYLADDRLLVLGGHVVDGVGLPNAGVYDATLDTWSPLPEMNLGRWYPTVTALGDGRALVLSGSVTPEEVNELPQVWDGEIGEFEDLDEAEKALPLYPWVYSTPDGRAFVAGPEGAAQFLSVEVPGEWQETVPSALGFRDYGSSVTYAAGKILIAGGSPDVDGAPPVERVEVIDLNEELPEWTEVSPMFARRRQFTTVVLADGSVFAVGGTSSPGFNDALGSVRTPEVWDPRLDAWTPLEYAHVPRIYHHTALLLPDARVFVAGGGHPPGTHSEPHHNHGGGNQQDWEIFSPPYLHTGRPRPVIATLPQQLYYGRRFRAEIVSESVPTVNLTRLGAMTHDFNQSQAFLADLELSPSECLENSYHIVVPDTPNVAPPGPYMLFAVSDGVPSVARIVNLVAGTTGDLEDDPCAGTGATGGSGGLDGTGGGGAATGGDGGTGAGGVGAGGVGGGNGGGGALGGDSGGRGGGSGAESSGGGDSSSGAAGGDVGGSIGHSGNAGQGGGAGEDNHPDKAGGTSSCTCSLGGATPVRVAPQGFGCLIILLLCRRRRGCRSTGRPSIARSHPQRMRSE